MKDKNYSYTKKCLFALGNLEKLVFWSILSVKNTWFVSVFSGEGFFERTRENVLQIFRALLPIMMISKFKEKILISEMNHIRVRIKTNPL